MSKIIWKSTGTDPNDLIAKVGRDTLRVEKMDEKFVWWAIWIGDQDYKNTFDVHHSKKKRPTTIEEAKKQCEEKYKEVKK